MDRRNAMMAEAAAAQLRLPAHLRTEHWYNDWQHAVFIITFEHLMRALRNGSALAAQRLVDRLTVYLHVHFLCEEEGMTWAVANGAMRPEALRAHQAAHVKEIDTWHERVQAPFATDRLRDPRLAGRIQDFYERILGHIDELDQGCYGTKSRSDEALRLDQAAHVAACGLPLSPNMGGAVAVVGACNPRAHALLDSSGLPMPSRKPLKRLALADLPAQSGFDSLRSRFLRAMHGEVPLRRAA